MTLGLTKIPYLTRLWHPTTGCSADCPYCWARDLVRNRLAPTMKGLPKGYGYPAAPGPIRLHDMLSRSDPFTPTFHSDRFSESAMV